MTRPLWESFRAEHPRVSEDRRFAANIANHSVVPEIEDILANPHEYPSIDLLAVNDWTPPGSSIRAPQSPSATAIVTTMTTAAGTMMTATATSTSPPPIVQQPQRTSGIQAINRRKNALVQHTRNPLAEDTNGCPRRNGRTQRLIFHDCVVGNSIRGDPGYYQCTDCGFVRGTSSPCRVRPRSIASQNPAVETAFQVEGQCTTASTNPGSSLSPPGEDHLDSANTTMQSSQQASSATTMDSVLKTEDNKEVKVETEDNTDNSTSSTPSTADTDVRTPSGADDHHNITGQCHAIGQGTATIPAQSRHVEAEGSGAVVAVAQDSAIEYIESSHSRDQSNIPSNTSSMTLYIAGGSAACLSTDIPSAARTVDTMPEAASMSTAENIPLGEHGNTASHTEATTLDHVCNGAGTQSTNNPITTTKDNVIEAEGHPSHTTEHPSINNDRPHDETLQSPVETAGDNPDDAMNRCSNEEELPLPTEEADVSSTDGADADPTAEELQSTAEETVVNPPEATNDNPSIEELHSSAEAAQESPDEATNGNGTHLEYVMNLNSEAYSKINSLEKQVETLQAEKQSSEEQIATLAATKHKLETRNEELTNELQESKETLAEALGQTQSTFEEQQRQHRETKAELQSKIGNWNKELMGLRNQLNIKDQVIKQAYAERRASAEKLTTLKDEMQKLQSEAALAQEKLKQQMVAEWEEEKSTMGKKINELNGKVEDLQIAMAENELVLLEAQDAKISAHKAKEQEIVLLKQQKAKRLAEAEAEAEAGEGPARKKARLDNQAHRSEQG